MHYSLFSRFQGCLLGMVLGERLGAYTKTLPASPRSLQPPDRWLQLALHYTETLGRTGRWQGETGEAVPALEDGFSLSVAPLIATLPLSLFFHDDLIQQRQYLRQLVRQWGGQPSMEDWGVLLGYAIAQALKEQLNPQALVPQLMAYLRVSSPEIWQRSPQIIQALEQIKICLEQDVGLQTAALKLQYWPQSNPATTAAEPATGAIALALYCFLRTPDHFDLTVTQVANMCHQCAIHPSAIALAGALSGAHNSVASIPVHWSTSPLIQSAAAVYSLAQIQTLSSRLLEAWSGIYNACQLSIEHHPVVAAPWIIRPR